MGEQLFLKLSQLFGPELRSRSVPDPTRWREASCPFLVYTVQLPEITGERFARNLQERWTCVEALTTLINVGLPTSSSVRKFLLCKAPAHGG